MNMKKIIIFGMIVLGFSSCHDWMDINYDPNSPSEQNLTSSLIFPAVEMDLANDYGNFFRIMGGYYAQQYSQIFGTSNYTDYSQFMTSPIRSDRPFDQMSTHVLNNLKIVIDMASSSEDWGTYLAATCIRAFTYQILVDAYGEIPYTEALDINNLAPKFDDGLIVYNGLLGEIDEALSKVAISSTVCTNFLYKNASADEWIKFANAIKLKLLMRMSNTQDVSSQLAALIAENNFPTHDVAWSDCWADASGKANPFYQEEFATYFGSTQINVIGNIALIATMFENNDARLPYFFEKNISGNYTGGVSGTNFSSSNYGATYWNRPVMKYNSPVFLITISEIEFFLSEYYARYGSAADAEIHYKAAIEASFNTCGASGANGVYNSTEYKYNNANYAKLLGIQKWIALSGTNNFEAWCEMRRLKYPTFNTSVSGNDLYDINSKVYTPEKYMQGTLYTPIQVNTLVGENKLVERFMYPQSSVTRNSNAPEQKSPIEPVFWAK
jgi:hypothetical protein